MSAAKAGGGKTAKAPGAKASNSKPSGPSSTAAAVAWLFGPGRSLTILLVITGALAGAIVVSWPKITSLVEGNPDLWLTPQGIEITPPPAWVHSDIRTEVVRDASLNGAVSLLDAQLVARVRDAFALHPWVAKVVRVEKRHPARVAVEIEYRRPVAMVEVPGGLFPIDGQGRLLPTADFSSTEAGRYPRVTGIATTAVGPVGTTWGDPRVEGAGRIAAVFIDDWAQLGLQTIVPSTSALSTYELFTARGTKVLWGYAPMAQPSGAGEADAVLKLARLKKLAARQGSLDGPEGPQDIDVRPAGDAP